MCVCERERESKWVGGCEREREKRVRTRACVCVFVCLKLSSLNKAVQIYNAHTHIYDTKKLSYWCSFIL